jgi:hypothetical protein
MDTLTRLVSQTVLALLSSAVLSAQPVVTARTIEVPFASHDGFPLFGKLTVSATPGRHAVFIYVQTAEGATVDMRRPSPKGGTFNDYDL